MHLNECHNSSSSSCSSSGSSSGGGSSSSSSCASDLRALLTGRKHSRSVSSGRAVFISSNTVNSTILSITADVNISPHVQYSETSTQYNQCLQAEQFSYLATASIAQFYQ